jgi:hypothetical protein
MQTQPGLPPESHHPVAAYAHQPSRPYNLWAIVSVSFGASTVIGSWCFGGLIAVITGHVARHQIKQTGEAGANLALAGLIAGYVAIALTLLFILAYIGFFVLMIAFAGFSAAHSSPMPSASP